MQTDDGAAKARDAQLAIDGLEHELLMVREAMAELEEKQAYIEEEIRGLEVWL